jgi:hypothetical protein
VPVSPDNVHETGVSLDGQSGSPIVAAEAQQVEQLEEDLVTGPDPRFLCPSPPRTSRTGFGSCGDSAFRRKRHPASSDWSEGHLRFLRSYFMAHQGLSNNAP